MIDETPAAYKSIDAVMAAQKDLVEVVHTPAGSLRERLTDASLAQHPAARGFGLFNDVLLRTLQRELASLTAFAHT